MTGKWALPYAALAVSLAQTDQPDLAVGKRVYEVQCALCHAPDGSGGRGPALKGRRLRRAATDEALKKIIRDGIPGTEMGTLWVLTPKEVASVAAFVRSLERVPAEALPGDASLGVSIYRAQGCAGCHIVNGEGSAAGPDLSDIGARRNAAYLREALLKPASAVPEGFLMVEAVPGDGAAVEGLRLNEDSFTIQIMDSRRRIHSFRKAALRELRKLFDQSPMPAYDRLPAGELDDLVAYVASLRGGE
ncbi:MAG: c-type cytochrome [Bryobacteraceae bacterium]